MEIISYIKQQVPPSKLNTTAIEVLENHLDALYERIKSKTQYVEECPPFDANDQSKLLSSDVILKIEMHAGDGLTDFEGMMILLHMTQLV
ncbi:hypothetical protein AwErysi_01020 [Erysipelotrichaceae bacterium]|nr:hypothetical protein AwErysi_01020 [Erysipelotrichaceae bacterium]